MSKKKLVDPQKFPATSKNFRRPPKISGDPRKFPATPENFRRRPKRPKCRGGRKCYFLSVVSVEMHPIERASRCPGKVRIRVILGWDRLFDQKWQFSWIFCTFLPNFEISGKSGVVDSRKIVPTREKPPLPPPGRIVPKKVAGSPVW